MLHVWTWYCILKHYQAHHTQLSVIVSCWVSDLCTDLVKVHQYINHLYRLLKDDNKVEDGNISDQAKEAIMCSHYHHVSIMFDSGNYFMLILDHYYTLSVMLYVLLSRLFEKKGPKMFKIPLQMYFKMWIYASSTIFDQYCHFPYKKKGKFICIVKILQSIISPIEKCRISYSYILDHDWPHTCMYKLYYNI